MCTASLHILLYGFAFFFMVLLHVCWTVCSVQCAVGFVAITVSVLLPLAFSQEETKHQRQVLGAAEVVYMCFNRNDK
jgi:hypothetical protein